MDLITNSQLTERFSIPWNQVEAALQASKLEPVHQYQNGRGTVKLYSTEDAVKAVEAHLLAKQLAASKRGEVEQQPEPPIATRILQAVEQEAKEDESFRSEVLAALARLSDQNVALLRVVEHLRADALARMEALHAEFDSFAHPMPVDVPPPAPKAVPEAPKLRPLRVAIVGVLSNQRGLLDREFRSIFDLRITTTDELSDTKKLEASMRGCDVGVFMSNYVKHANDMGKRAGIPVIAVNGGLTTLRDRLTALYCDADQYRRERSVMEA